MVWEGGGGGEDVQWPYADEKGAALWRTAVLKTFPPRSAYGAERLKHGKLNRNPYLLFKNLHLLPLFPPLLCSHYCWKGGGKKGKSGVNAVHRVVLETSRTWQQQFTSLLLCFLGGLCQGLLLQLPHHLDVSCLPSDFCNMMKRKTRSVKSVLWSSC